MQSKPFELVVFLEDEVEMRTGCRPVLSEGPSRGREFGSAKRLLAYLDDDLEKAMDVVEFWLDDNEVWWRKNAPSLSTVYSRVSIVVFQMAMRETKAESYLRSESPRVEKKYLRK